MLSVETELHLRLKVEASAVRVNDLAAWLFSARAGFAQMVMAQLLWRVQEQHLRKVFRGEAELFCKRCGVVHESPADLSRRGSRRRKVRTSVGLIRFRLRQVTCLLCRRTWSPYAQLLGLRPRQRITDELEKRLVDWVLELSYAKTSRLGREWLGETLSPSGLHAAVQRRGPAATFTEAEPFEVLVADGTHVRAGTRPRGEPLRVAFQIQGRRRRNGRPVVRKRVVGVDIGRGSFGTALATRRSPKLVVTDAESGLKQLVRSYFPRARHQLCSWHLGYTLDILLRRDGMRFKDRCRQVQELTSILWANGRGDRQRYEAFARRLSGYRQTSTLLENSRDMVLFDPPSAERTTSIAEREMREINRRSDVGVRWSIPGAANLLALRLAHRHNRDEYERIWPSPRSIRSHLVPHP